MSIQYRLESKIDPFRICVDEKIRDYIAFQSYKIQYTNNYKRQLEVLK